MSGMPQAIDELLRASSLFRRVGVEDRRRVADVARTRTYGKGETIFAEGDPSEVFFTIASGRVKIVKMLASGKDVIIEIFGAGDPFGAVAAYEGRPFPASAIALEDTTCLLVPRQAFFSLLEQHPSLVRGLLLGLTLRLIELTNRLADMSGARVEARFARFFLKIAETSGRLERGGVFVPLPLTRQELADLTGTTIETAIRIMSRWGKENVVRTERDGFVLLDRHALETLAAT